MRKAFKLQDLDCANCAAKMENAIKNIEGVKSASISFMTQKLVLEADDDRFEAVVVGFQHQLLRHEADGGAFHAFDVLDGVLHLRSAVRAVEILEFECLSHGGVLSFRRSCERGRAVRSRSIPCRGRCGAYSQIWVMPWASIVYTWSSDSE